MRNFYNYLSKKQNYISSFFGARFLLTNSGDCLIMKETNALDRIAARKGGAYAKKHLHLVFGRA